MDKRMDANEPNDATIRAYLLGQMKSDDLVQRIDELMLCNDKFSENIDVIEDEIIEEYVEGTLSAAEQKAVESHFLRPQERQRKLDEVRLFTRCFSAAARNSLGEVQKATIRPHVTFSMLSQSRLRFGMYVGIAAVALLTLLSGYLFLSRRQLEAEVLRSNDNLVQERERSSILSQQIRTAPAIVLPSRQLQTAPASGLPGRLLLAESVVAPPQSLLLSLVQPGVRRSDETLPELRISAGTTNIHVEIALPSGRGGEYHVRLETSGRIAWNRENVQAFSSPSVAILMLDVPGQVFAAGESRFVISQKSEIDTYSFIASRE